MFNTLQHWPVDSHSLTGFYFHDNYRITPFAKFYEHLLPVDTIDGNSRQFSKPLLFFESYFETYVLTAHFTLRNTSIVCNLYAEI